MTKAKNKILNFVFLGLLVFAAPLSYAQAQGIQAQKADDFMKEKIAPDEYQAYLADVNQTQVDKHLVVCGNEKCDLKTSVCLAKDRKNVFGRIKKKYMCLSKMTQSGQEKIKNYETNGWQIYKEEEVPAVTEKQCYKAAKKEGSVEKYCFEAIDNEVRILNGTSKRSHCEVVPVRWYNNKDCAFCKMLGTVYAVSDKLTVLSYEKLGTSFAVVLALGLAVWIAMKTLIFASSMTKQDAAKYLTEMIKQGYKFAIAYFALIYYPNIFDYLLLPLLRAGLTFSQQFMSGIDLSYRFDENITANLMANNVDSLQNSGLDMNYYINFNNQYFDISTYSVLDMLAYNVNMQYALLQSIGGALWCLSGEYALRRVGQDMWQGFDMIQAWGFALAGYVYAAAFWVFGFLLSIAFVFYLFDAVVQLGIVGALLPFLIASWPFKITSKYTSTGFKMFLNSVFTFIMIGIIVKINIELISVAVELNTVDNSDMGHGLTELANAIDQIDTLKLTRMVNVLSIGFLLFLFANLMGFLVLSKISELVDRFASGGMKAVAPSIATMGASAVKGAAAKVTAPIRKSVGEWVDDTVEKGVKKAVKAVPHLVKGAGQAAFSIATLKPVRKAIGKKMVEKSSRLQAWKQQRENAKKEKAIQKLAARQNKDLDLQQAQASLAGEAEANSRNKEILNERAQVEDKARQVYDEVMEARRAAGKPLNSPITEEERQAAIERIRARENAEKETATIGGEGAENNDVAEVGGAEGAGNDSVAEVGGAEEAAKEDQKYEDEHPLGAVSVDSNQNLVDANGNIVGAIDEDGNVINQHGEIITHQGDVKSQLIKEKQQLNNDDIGHEAATPKDESGNNQAFENNQVENSKTDEQSKREEEAAKKAKEAEKSKREEAAKREEAKREEAKREEEAKKAEEKAKAEEDAQKAQEEMLRSIEQQIIGYGKLDGNGNIIDKSGKVIGFVDTNGKVVIDSQNNPQAASDTDPRRPN